MRILHLLYDHCDNPWLGGGGAVRALEINRRLVASGCKIDLICGGFPGRSLDNWNAEGIDYHSTASSAGYLASRLAYNRGYRKIVEGLIAQHRYDLVVNDISTFSTTKPWRFWKGPTVALIHNLIGRRLFTKLGPFGLPFYLWEKRIIFRHTATITVSRWLAQRLQSRGVRNVEVIYNGVNPRAFHTTSPAEQKTILSLGRIDIFQKGLDLLLESFAAVQKQIPDAQLWIAGSGSDLKKLQKIVAQKKLKGITFLGRVTEERFELIARSTVVAIPSRFEGWGIVAIEAAAVGRPVVGSGADGLAEAIADGKSGTIVRGSPEAFAMELIRLLNAPDLCREMGKGGRQHARAFEWNAIAEQQLALYHKVVESDHQEE